MNRKNISVPKDVPNIAKAKEAVRSVINSPTPPSSVTVNISAGIYAPTDFIFDENDCSEKTKVIYKAEAGVDEELEAPFHALFENFEKKSDEKNAHDKGEDYYCDCHFILSPSNALKFRHAALRRALRALISWMQASRMSGSELWLKQM